MTIRVKTVIENRGIMEPRPEVGLVTMEQGYGVYVNAYVYDDETGSPDDEPEGLYASELVHFANQHDQEIVAAARRRARARARMRYTKERARERGEDLWQQ